jgi:hypothetical protein
VTTETGPRRYAVDGALGVREARDRYLDENGFSTDTYTAPRVTVDFVFGSRVTFPNTRDRQRAIPLHDLHHVATGYGTDLVGEGEIGAWEIAAGCNTLALYVLNGTVFLLGLLTHPIRTLRAFRIGLAQRTLYREAITYDALLAMTVFELRALLGVPPDGLADRPPGFNASARRARERSA